MVPKKDSLNFVAEPLHDNLYWAYENKHSGVGSVKYKVIEKGSIRFARTIRYWQESLQAHL